MTTFSTNNIKDIMTGYRAFSYEFVKTFPVLSKGFEIETEMSIHAIDKNMFVENVVITNRDRPEGSVSKLDTYSDGFKVLKTIARLYRAYKPMGFFGIIALILAVIATAFFSPNRRFFSAVTLCSCISKSCLFFCAMVSSVTPTKSDWIAESIVKPQTIRVGKSGTRPVAR